MDDSIVRGTTAKELIQMAKDAGAKKVSTYDHVCTCLFLFFALSLQIKTGIRNLSTKCTLPEMCNRMFDHSICLLDRCTSPVRRRLCGTAMCTASTSPPEKS